MKATIHGLSKPRNKKCEYEAENLFIVDKIVVFTEEDTESLPSFKDMLGEGWRAGSGEDFGEKVTS
ncbi:MAG: hypothetical protein ACYCSS_14605 [Sulfuriferula sp.]